MMTGFSPRARDIAVCILPGVGKFESLLKRLGQHKTRKSCLYTRKLEDIGEKVLTEPVADSVREMRRKYGQQ